MEDGGRVDPERTDHSEGGVPLDVIPLHSTNLLTVLDRTGIIRYESPSIERLYGYDQADLLGDQVAEYVHPDDRERVVDAFRTVVDSTGETTEAVEYRHEQADGSYRWVESITSTNPTPNGHYVVNTRDISDRKARERELERTNERLKEFASVVSHDLRNPLNVASGRMDLALAECESDHLAAVDRAHERMENLIDDLLAYTRAGDGATEIRRIELSPLVNECWQTVATAGATLRVETNSVLRADPERFRQLIENLFRNAIEHGDTNVTITVGELPDGIYVADDGSGIPEHERERVFESGYSTRQAGTGLGLAIVSQIAMAHDWEIRATESDAGGARFEITGVEFDPR